MLFHIHFRLQATIIDLSLTPTNGGVYVNPVVLLDIENIFIAVGISLLSCIYKVHEIYVIPYPLPVISLIYFSL